MLADTDRVMLSGMDKVMLGGVCRTMQAGMDALELVCDGQGDAG